MSTRTMTRQCVHCKRIYTYNPSVGDMGTVCKYCHKPQLRTHIPTVPCPKQKQNESSPLKKSNR